MQITCPFVSLLATVLGSISSFAATAGAGIEPPLQRGSPPAVDFDKFTLLVVTSGTKPTLGYSVLFQDTFEFPNELRVHVLDVGTRGCATGQMVTHPSGM